MTATTINRLGIALTISLLGSLPLWAQNPGAARLKGELINYDKKFELSSQNPLDVLQKNNIEVTLDEANRFELTIPLDGPAYYKLGRNTIYLEPGYDLTIVSNADDPEQIQVTGPGAAPSMYLRYKPFPKGGSFLESGRLLRQLAGFDQVKAKIGSILSARMDSLAAYPGLPASFVALERSRNYLSAANSFDMYPGYLPLVRTFNSREEAKAATDSAEVLAAPEFERYIRLAGYLPQSLALEEYRYLAGPVARLSEGQNLPAEVTDYLKTSRLLGNLSYLGPVKEVLQQKDSVALQLSPDYRRVVQTTFEKYDHLLPGKPGADFKLYDSQGNPIRLSDMAGNVVLVDIWATWCGPCKYESPFFEKLAEEYAGRNVVFVSVCIQSRKEDWLKAVTESPGKTLNVFAESSEFAPYFLSGIPRFLAFDANGKIIDAFAPRPSQPEFRKMLNQAL